MIRRADDFGRLQEAVEKLYYAAYWAPDRYCDARKLWEDVRAAAGFEHGQTSKILGEPNRIFHEANQCVGIKD
jgi:hypothetical protein